MIGKIGVGVVAGAATGFLAYQATEAVAQHQGNKKAPTIVNGAIGLLVGIDGVAQLGNPKWRGLHAPLCVGVGAGLLVGTLLVDRPS